MSWKPSFEHARPDPRLDLYRGRAGRLSRDGVEAGHVLVEADYLAPQIGGHLWWRRWGPPAEFAKVDTLLADGTYDDAWVIGDDLDPELDDWGAGRFRFGGTTYELTWLDDAASARVHHEVFGHHHP